MVRPAHMPEDMTSGEHEVCTEFSHSFLDRENVYIVGYQCSNTFLFWGVVVASFILVVVQVKIGVRDGQASRMAPPFSCQIRGYTKRPTHQNALYCLPPQIHSDRVHMFENLFY